MKATLIFLLSLFLAQIAGANLPLQGGVSVAADRGSAFSSGHSHPSFSLENITGRPAQLFSSELSLPDLDDEDEDEATVVLLSPACTHSATQDISAPAGGISRHCVLAGRSSCTETARYIRLRSLRI